MKLIGAALITVVLLALATACANDGSSPSPEPSAQPADGEGLTYVAFGDSWPFGAHCNGCTPFPELYEQALRNSGTDVEFVDRTTNGGTSADLRNMIEKSESVREVVADADIVVISTGMNDLEPAGERWKQGSCGGSDGLDCFRATAEEWNANFDAITTEIAALREGRPTAVRLLGNSNEFLADPGLIEYFGAEFATAGGAEIVQWHNDAMCQAAEGDRAVCIDLRDVLNGPDGTEPADVNTQEAMQKVADALYLSGLAELE